MIEVRESFIHIIEQQLGRKLAAPVRAAFLQIPRHLFVQHYYQQHEKSLSWNLVPATPDHVYRDEALVTQIDRQGIPSSSTSQPSVMAAQLEALVLAPGQRVLEIGVGTGYNAALMGTMIGNTGNVISIDIDEDLVGQAKQHLALAAVKNVIALPGDGFLGETEHAPYDRIIATCGIRSIPLPWFDQLKPGGRFVGNWMLPLASLFVSVEKTGAGELTGTFLDIEASYMEMRTEEKKPAKQKIDWAIFDTQPAESIVLPDALIRFQNPAQNVLLQCLLPTMKKHYRMKDEQLHLFLLAEEAAIKIEEERLLIFGNTKISHIIQHCLDLYQWFGQPQISQYRVTLQKQQAVIHIGDQHLRLPLS
jgi:protein-L-isoaspartate(D-aspartate) O-methyltransferase